MTEAKDGSLTWQEARDMEIRDLRLGALDMFLAGSVCISVAWFFYAVLNPSFTGPEVTPTFILLLAFLGAYALRARNLSAASWVLLLGMILAEGAIVLGQPSPTTIGFGAAVIIAANALLDTRAAVLAGALAWASALMASTAAGVVGSDGAAGRMAALYVVTATLC